MTNLTKLIYVRRFLAVYFLMVMAFLFSIRQLVYLTPGPTVMPSLIFMEWFGRATESHLTIVFLLAIVSALIFFTGRLQQIAAFGMYLSLIFLIQANTLLMEIHYTYLGYLLLAFVLSPNFQKDGGEFQQKWADRFSLAVFYALGISFTYLGLVKLLYPHYYTDRLADFLLSVPDAHPHNVGIFDFLNRFLRAHLSPSLKISLGLAGAIGELLILPLILFRKTRIVAHFLLLAVILYIGVLVNYWHISLMLLIFQVAALDVNDWPLKSQ